MKYSVSVIKTRHHDTDSDSEDEDEDDVDVVEVPLRKRRAAGRRFGGQRNGGRHRQEGGRRQRNPVLCGTYDPTTGDISISQPCTKGVCEKLDEDTNEVFCKCDNPRGRDEDDDGPEVPDLPDFPDVVPVLP